MALDGPLGTVTHTFPSPEALVDARLDGLGLTGARIATIHELAKGVAAGRVVLDPGVRRSELEAELVALPGVGPWTAGYIAMRALSDPDVFLAADLGVRRALERAGLPARPAEAAALAERWRPWRSYALVHLWSTLEEPR
jgi:AraC family transcriptional regulator of adaptative response / DNA-3-methyladenine glycosylase II